LDVKIKTTPDPPTGDVPFTVYFDASETDCGCGTATYSWNFGDGSSAGNGVTTSHIYNSNGIYTVILTVTTADDNIGYGSVVINVGVTGEVNAVIKVTPESASGTAPFTVGLDASESTTSASGATILRYTWNFDSDTPIIIDIVPPATKPIPVITHEFTSAGTHLVQLTVEDSLGNKGYAFKSIVATK
jgi:PKD repeat protein